MIHIVGKLWILALIWHRAIYIWSILQAVRIFMTCWNRNLWVIWDLVIKALRAQSNLEHFVWNMIYDKWTQFTDWLWHFHTFTKHKFIISSRATGEGFNDWISDSKKTLLTINVIRSLSKNLIKCIILQLQFSWIHWSLEILLARSVFEVSRSETFL